MVSEHDVVLGLKTAVFHVYGAKHPLSTAVSGSSSKAKPLVIQMVAGIIKEVGLQVKHLKLDDRVVGITKPSCKGVEDLTQREAAINAYQTVPLPPEVNPADAVACLFPALKLHSAFLQLPASSSVESDTPTILLLFTGDINLAILALQMSTSLGFRLLVWASTESEVSRLKPLCESSKNCKLIDWDPFDRNRLPDICLEYTDRRGVDAVFHFEDSDHTSEQLDSFAAAEAAITTGDILGCLAVGGRWITTKYDVQLSQAESELMFLKNASLHFLFEATWILSPLHIGQFQRIITDIMAALKDKKITPLIWKILELDSLQSSSPTANIVDILETQDENGCVVYRT